jgi:cytosine/adenosine deaminase-related metal-dependent hydrolase
MKNNILIRNAAAIMTGLPGSKARSSARDIRIESGVITEMGNGLPPLPDEEQLDASNCVIYPGWVNTHHHLFQSLLKGVPAGINLTLSPWLQAVPFSYRRSFDEKRLRIAVRIGLVELLRSGCTTVPTIITCSSPDRTLMLLPFFSRKPTRWACASCCCAAVPPSPASWRPMKSCYRPPKHWIRC